MPFFRRLTFSLRTSMVLLLAVAAWLGWITHKARQQRIAVAAIKQYGGQVDYECGSVNGKIGDVGEPWAPNWLRTRIGEEYFRDIAFVTLYVDGGRQKNPRDDAQVMSYVRSLTSLRSLDLVEGQASDARLGDISGLTNLEGLFIEDAAGLTADGIGHLSGMRKLKELEITTSKLSDAALSRLRSLTSLEYLALEGNSFSDAGLANLQDMTQLKELFIGNGDIELTDDGLAHLKRLTSLEFLSIQNHPITDRGLDHLKGMHKLREIDIKGTGITDDGVKKLQEALPSLKRVLK